MLKQFLKDQIKTLFNLTEAHQIILLNQWNKLMHSIKLSNQSFVFLKLNKGFEFLV